MDRPIVLAALYVAFLLGCVLTFFFGAAGTREYAQLETYHALLESNVRELESVGAELAARLEALRTSRETVRLLARELGYLEEGERRLYLNTLHGEPSFYQVGNVPGRRYQPRLSAQPLNALTFAPLIGFFVLLCVHLSRAGGHGRTDRSV